MSGGTVTASWTVVGVDPGGRATGLAVRSGTGHSRTDVCLHGEVITRTDDMTAYLAEVLAAIREARAAHDPVYVAVEGLNAPTPHLGLTSVVGLIGTAQVLGAVRATQPMMLVVPPAGHGSAPLAAYPSRLVGARERRGAGKARHARSAYDVAGAALLAYVRGRVA